MDEEPRTSRRPGGPIDSHCHLQYFEPDEEGQVLDAAREAGVTGFLVPAIRLDDADRLLAMAARESDVWCAIGVHPHEAQSWDRESAGRLRRLVDDPRVVAVGECGLDFHYDFSPREQQLVAVREQWEVALDAGLPVIVHNRDSNEEMARLVADPSLSGVTGVLHSYAGGPSLATAAVERGFYLGISGMVTFPRADNVREVLPATPVERLLVETDTPYLAPVPHRGKKNRPEWVVDVARRLAEEIELAYDDLASVTSENFFRLFPRASAST